MFVEVILFGHHLVSYVCTRMYLFAYFCCCPSVNVTFKINKTKLSFYIKLMNIVVVFFFIFGDFIFYERLCQVISLSANKDTVLFTTFNDLFFLSRAGTHAYLYYYNIKWILNPKSYILKAFMNLKLVHSFFIFYLHGPFV